MLRLKKALCIVLIFSIQLSIQVLGQDSRGNLTGMSQEELLDMHDLLLEQRWGSGEGIDLAALKIFGHSGNGLHSPGEYLNDSELNDVITSSDYLFQHQEDLINQSNSLLNQGKYNEASQVYDALLELDSIIDITRRCRCGAICIFAHTVPTTPMGDDYYPSGEPKQPLTYESVMEKRQSQEQLYLRCSECEYEVERAEYSEDPRITSLTKNMQIAKAALDEELAINESDPVYWYNLGERLQNSDELNRSDRMNESIAAFNKAIELNKTYVGAWDRKGFVLSFLDCDEAIKAFDKALEIDPDYVYSWSNKAFCLRDQGKSEEALKAYDKAIEIDPLNWKRWDTKARAQKEMGIEKPYYVKDFNTLIDGRGVSIFLSFVDKDTGDFATPKGKLLINLYRGRTSEIYSHVHDITANDYDSYVGGIAIVKWVSFEEMSNVSKLPSKVTGRFGFQDVNGITSAAKEETD